jgi:trypsin-like peptidase
MRLAAIVAAALLAPPVVAAPPRAPAVVPVAVGADRATGFVAADDRVVTVAHVLDGGEVTVGGRRATIVRRDDQLDLALLHVPGVRGSARPAAPGEGRVWIAGRPATVVRRIAARIDGAPPRPALELRATISTGDSGAPVVTRGGSVAGVVFARSNARPGTAYAVDAEALEDLLPLD